MFQNLIIFKVLVDPDKRSNYDKYGTINDEGLDFDFDEYTQNFGNFDSFIQMMMMGDVIIIYYKDKYIILLDVFSYVSWYGKRNLKLKCLK